MDSRATRESAGAFEHQFKTLDESLASDIEEGGGIGKRPAVKTLS
jgi:hypothetical protein